MDIGLVLGLIGGVGALLTGFVLEGGHIPSLILLSPAVVVFGGTTGALLAQFQLKHILSVPSIIKFVAFEKSGDAKTVIETLVRFAEKARREGILSLENEVNSKSSDLDPLLVKGAQLAVDGTEPSIVSDILENEIYMFERAKKEDAEIFEAAGGYSPTMGIIGTVMGLVHVLGNLSDPSSLGPSIAAAFIATLYGVASANLVFLPIGTRVKNKGKAIALQKGLILEGIKCLQSGENPHIVKQKLIIFLEEHERHAMEAEEGH